MTTNPSPITFPKGFKWGSATASYQIEGSVEADGKGPSVWDTFVEREGVIEGGDTGQVACDHYRRFSEDIALMKQLKHQAYRFSFSWSRLFPDGTGEPNEQGFQFYDRLIDGLLEAGIEPCPTLYHWDLPQALQNRGGWATKDSPDWFTIYAEALFKRYGDQVSTWFTLNEPNVHAFAGHIMGIHAPGLTDLTGFLRTVHNLNRGHGRAVSAFRALVPDGKIGPVINVGIFEGETDSEDDRAAAARVDMVYNGGFLEPMLKGVYPEEMAPFMQAAGLTLDDVTMSEINAPVDFLGLNFYSRTQIRSAPDAPMGAASARGEGESDRERTDMGWEVFPEGFYDALMRVHRDYSLPIIVTENGAAFPDQKTHSDEKPRVSDPKRIAFLESYIRQLHRAIEDGCNVSGYFVWTLLDNFEWAEGFRRRFGLVHVDFDTLERTPKDSAFWYRDVIDANGIT
ncbi:MAG: GH1 family beta-glucosidase [Pseudomonadota bacterium]